MVQPEASVQITAVGQENSGTQMNHFTGELKPIAENNYLRYRITDSSVSIATDYGLDGPGSNPGGDEIFRPSRQALGPTQPPVEWVPGLSRGKVRPGRAADHSPSSSAAVMEE